MKKAVAVVLLALSSCCHKRGCPHDELPVYVFTFRGYPPGFRVVGYEFMNGVVTDSTVSSAADGAMAPVLSFQSHNDYNDATATGKSFVIVREGKRDSLWNFSAVFNLEKRVCNRCLFGSDKQEIWDVHSQQFDFNGTPVNESNPFELDY